MNPSLQFRPVAITIFVLLAVSYVLCIVADLLLGWQMVSVWAPLLPGFTVPLSTVGLLVGSLWIVGYSLYGAALIVFPYNYLTRQQTR